MSSGQLFAGILYNAFEPEAGRQEEQESERAVEKAAAQVSAALAGSEYRTALFPVRRRIKEVVDRIQAERPDVLINLCEGFRGQSAYEAQVAGLLELLGIPFTGNPARALSLCQDKFRAKAVLRLWELPVPRGWLVAMQNEIPELDLFPLIVKLNAEDASIGISPQSVVKDRDALRAQVARLRGWYAQDVLIEEYIDGREFNVAIVDDPAPRALPVAEIRFEDFSEGMPRIVGYEAKWQETCELYRRTVPVCPVSGSLAEQLQRMALWAYQAMGARGYACVEFRVDAREQPFILEVNPNPDTSLDAGLARALAAAGIAYEAFWGSQLQLAMNALPTHEGRL